MAAKEMKYDSNYIDTYYTKIDKIYFRNNDSPIESQIEKRKCLLAVMGNICGSDFSKENIPAEFKKISGPRVSPNVRRCICSQREDHLHHYIIEHKESIIQFCIGTDCFNNLFDEKYHQELLDFSKDTCNFCDHIIQRRNRECIGFCSNECKKKYGYPCCSKCKVFKTGIERKFALCKKCYFSNICYTECENCGKAKNTETEQKFKLCYSCFNN
jgi:hypothetical protein